MNHELDPSVGYADTSPRERGEEVKAIDKPAAPCP